jgi:phage protein D/phage baseplate assembly protein gpV
MTTGTASKWVLTIGGNAIPDDIDDLVSALLVDSSLNQPDMFVASFTDPERVVLSKSGAAIGATLTVKVVSDGSPEGDGLFNGEITALGAEHDPSGTFTIIRAYDQSHRFLRGRVTQTYQNVTYADIVKKVIARAGLDEGQVDATSSVVPYVSQNNISDWQFLGRLAREVGFSLNVSDGKVDFKAPPQANSGPDKGDINGAPDPGQLVVGGDLLRVRSVVTAAEQVSQVEVRGWDPGNKQAVTATASAATKTASVGLEPGDLASAFGSPTLLSVVVPYSSDAEVNAAAEAIADHVAGAFVDLDGSVRGNAKLKAGSAISLALLGDPFDGKYVLSAARHRFNPEEGYTTGFTVSGRNQRSILGLSSVGSAGMTLSGGSAPIAGVVCALVTDVNDPDDLGRVKVSFPWLSDQCTTDWARMVQLGAGDARGAVFLPEVNDEVLVAFDRGDWRQPYVIGSLYNGVDKPALGDDLIDGSSGAVKRRGFISKNGHALVFLDDDSDDGLCLFTGDKNHRVSLNKSTTTVKVSSSGQVNIDGAQGVSISSNGNIGIEASGTLTLQGSSVSITATDADVSVSGQPINLN